MTKEEREKKIKAIYEKVADKTLSEGCLITLTKHYYKVKIKEDGSYEEIEGYLDGDGDFDTRDSIEFKFFYDKTLTKNTKIIGIKKFEGAIISKHLHYLLEDEFHYYYYELKDRENYTNFYNKQTYSYISKIIGHPVMIGDILDYIEKNIKLNQITIHNIKVDNDNLWKEKRKPIEEQPDNLINYVFDLIA